MNVEHLAELLAAAAERHQVPGAQLGLYRGGEILHAETGYERHGGATRVGHRSGFPYGSVTKAFTATVVLQLVSAGDVDLDEPIGSYVPELAAAPNGIGRLATPRHLLSHTSGLPCDFDSDAPAAMSFRRHALAAGTLELVHRPGAAFSYSNVGFVLAGLLIEEVSAMSWWDAVETLVLGPLDIEPVFCADPRTPPRRGSVVAGHSVNTRLRRTVPIEPLCPVFDAPAGGLAGSAADLVTFARMHLGVCDAVGLPAQPEIELMRRGAGEVIPFGLAAGWGLGLARFSTAGTDWFGHDGTTDGTTCHLRFEPVAGIGLAVTTNAVNGLRLWEDVLRALRDSGMDVGNYPVLAPTARPAAEIPECVGDYHNGDVHYSVARGGDGALYLDLDDGIRRDMTCYEGMRFRADAPLDDEPPVVGRFVRDDDTGGIGLMEISGRVARRRQSVVDPKRRKAGV